MHFSAEARLVLCCARTQMDSAHAERLRTLLGGQMDWRRVFDLASAHGLVPLVATHLGAAADAVPPEWLARLRRELRAAQFRNLRLAGGLVQVLRLFEDAGIRALTYKGPALAQELYGNLALRTFSDLDLLTAHADVARAREVLSHSGYLTDAGAFSGTRSGIAGQFLFHDAAGRVLLELHTERTLRHFPRPLRADWLLAAPHRVRVAEREVPTLAPAKLLIALAVHGTKDLWEQWKWVCDIAQFLRVHPAFDWPVAFDEARRLGCLRIVLMAVALARDLLDAALPESLARELRADPAAAGLAASLLRRMGQPGAGLSASARFFFRVNVCDSAADGLRHALRLTTTPAEEDWAAARLPAPLYPFLRPFRLLRKYGLR